MGRRARKAKRGSIRAHTAGGTAAERRPGSPWWHVPAGALLILLALLVVYHPALDGGFVWDDDKYVSANPTLRTADGLRQIWFDVGATIQYYPLVFTSFWVEYHLWELQPRGYHTVNVCLHALGAGLLWLVLRRLSVPGALLAAAAFALHPMHVESVAWITERKNVLSGVFYLLALLSYLRFDPPECGEGTVARAWRFYALALVLFAFALLSKTVTCSLPAVILLLLWWKRDRLALRDVLPLTPMFIIGAMMGLLTTWMEKHHVQAEGAEWTLSFVQRCLIAGRAVWFYLVKLIYPVDLTFSYPRWHVDAGLWWQYLYPLAAAAVVVLLWLMRRRIGKAPLVVALFFGGTLVPALGFIDVYPMRYSFVADHFQYLASIGPITLFAALLAMAAGRVRRGLSDRIEAPARSRFGTLFHVAAVLLLATLGTLSFRQAKIYAGMETLWRDTIRKNPSAWIAHINLGGLLLDRGDREQARESLAEAVRLNPRAQEARCSLAKALILLGRMEEGKQHFLEVLKFAPDFAAAHTGLGYVLERQGQLGQAIEHYNQALALEPANAQAHYNLAGALLRQGDVVQAVEHLRQSLRSRPYWPQTRMKLADALVTQGRIDDAIDEFWLVLRLQPQDSGTHFRLAGLLERQGRSDEAIGHYQTVIAIDPGHVPANQALNRLQNRQGNTRRP